MAEEENGFISYPPKILNIKPLNHRGIAIMACNSLGLPKRERTLFLFYESCSSGFRPALSRVKNETGIATNKISEIRKRLHNKCLICYDRERKTLMIQWDAIKKYANGFFINGLRFYSPDEYNYYFRKLKNCKPLYKFKNPCRQLSESEASFFNYISNLTAYEYDCFLKMFPEREGLRFKNIQVIDTEADIEEERKSLTNHIEIEKINPDGFTYPEYNKTLPF